MNPHAATLNEDPAEMNASEGDSPLVSGANGYNDAASQPLNSPATHRMPYVEEAGDSSDEPYVTPDSWDGEGNDMQALYRFIPQSNDETGPRCRQEAKIRSYRDESRINFSQRNGDDARPASKIDSHGEDGNTGSFPRISRPFELLRHSYDYIIIGSGYGGSVAASRMARTGQSVCVLERGSERWPGERCPDLSQQLHWSGDPPSSGVRPDGGDPTSLYHILSGTGQTALVGNGLGGTSLINANSFLQPSQDIFSFKAWPAEIRGRPDDMDLYYNRVEQVLYSNQYPDDWPILPKLELLKKQATFLGMAELFRPVRQTVRFQRGSNTCGVEMQQSSLQAEDSLGANDGSKTTTLVTYLADAWNWGAEIFCECEVRYIKKAERDGHDGYLVLFAWHGSKRDSATENMYNDLMWVFARKAVFLGAGTFGTAEVLLRSREEGLHTSDLVGHNISDNGDLIAFGYNVDYEVKAHRPRLQSFNGLYGPTTTSIIDNRLGHENPLNGYTIQDAAIPSAFRDLFEKMVVLIRPYASEISEPGSLFQRAAQWMMKKYGLSGYHDIQGAIDRTQVYVVMSHNASHTTVRLKKGKATLDTRATVRKDGVKRLNELLAKATEAIGGVLLQMPPIFGLVDRKLTVHPIGGAQMARDGTGETGATNHLGQVFTGRHGHVYEGLLVVDGALIPTSLGVGPFATIAALAERIVDLYAHRHNLTINMEHNGILDFFDEPSHLCPSHEKDETIPYVGDLIKETRFSGPSRVAFAEPISGFMHIHSDTEVDANDSQHTFKLAYEKGKGLFETARLFLIARSFKKARKSSIDSTILTGSLSYPALPGSPFMIHRGKLSAKNIDLVNPSHGSLVYDFNLHAVDGRILHFHGYQTIDLSDPTTSRNFWSSSAPLYATITRPNEIPPKGPAKDDSSLRRWDQVAKGILYFGSDRTRVKKTATPSVTDSVFLKRVINVASLMTHITYQAFSLFLAPSFSALQYPAQSTHGYINVTLPDHSVQIIATDGILTRLYVWEPTWMPGNCEPRTLFMIPGAAVDHQMYALPTIPFNAVNYFQRAGYRVFVCASRIGLQRHTGTQGYWTSYDARLDLRACLEYIRSRYGNLMVYTVAHCLGSVALACGLLDGTIPRDWILGITCSQMFMNPIWSSHGMMNALANGSIPTLQLYNYMAGHEFRFSTGPDDSVIQRVLNRLLRLYPDYQQELCNNATCHRASLVLGRCWNHRNLNSPTHRQLDRFLGGVSTALLQHALHMGREGVATTNSPSFEALTTPQSIARLRGIPIFLFVGADNAVVHPSSIGRTYDILVDMFGTAEVAYRHSEIPGYGHMDCWIGRNAWKDVYPLVREEVDRVVRGAPYRFQEPDDRFKHMMDSGALA